MSIVVDLSPEDAAALRELAEREHRSVEEVALLTIRARLQRDRRAAVMDELFDQAAAEDAELLRRLAQ